jgi:hypothetical protein
MTAVDLEIPEEDYYDPTTEESIGPSRLYATTHTRAPQYIAGQQGSAGGRIVDPRGGMTNVRFSEPMVRMRDFREAMARVQIDVSRLSGMIRGLNQTVASQANNNLMMSLFSLILGGPKVESATVETIKDQNGNSIASAQPFLPATVGLKDTKYKLDIMTLLPFFMFNMGGQMGYGSSTGGGMFGGSNFSMMLMMLVLIKAMEKDT